jgi:CRP-like cAMP-binding protein
MISTERLRYYSFFGGLDDEQLKAIAMIAAEETHERDEILFQKGMPAEALYFLEEGCIDLYYYVNGAPTAEFKDGIPVGEVNPGEPFSISAIIAPYRLTATAKVCQPSRMIKIDALALRDLFQKDQRLAYLMVQKAARIMIERLHATRVQLASILA